MSNAPDGSEPSVPRIASGPSGRLLLVYQQKPEWRIYFRQRSTGGNWGPIEILGTDFCAGRADVIEDASGRAHVVFPQRGAGATYDLMHAIRHDGGWAVSPIMSTGGAGDYEDYPRLARDSLGRIHLVYTRTTDTGSGNIAWRLWDGSTWSGEEIVGPVSQAYYQRPDISVDALDRTHFVWVVNGGYRNLVRYRRRAAGVWSAAVTIGQSTPSGASATFLAHARVGAFAGERVLALWQEESVVTYAHSADGGLTWSSPQALVAGNSSSLHAGGGLAHVAYMPVPPTSVIYRTWNGSAWSAPATTTPLSAWWKGWPDLTDDAAGGIHVVYDDVTNDNNRHQISYVSSEPDRIPPAPVAAFNAIAGNANVRLTWLNPNDPDFRGTIVRYATTGYPTSPSDGSLVCDRLAAPGSNDVFYHSHLVNGVVYYYTAFAYDTNGLYAPGTTVSARPIAAVDLDRDGDVDLSDFAAFQLCFNGPNRSPTLPTCTASDFDNDGDVDLADFAIFQTCFNGPNRPPGCR